MFALMFLLPFLIPLLILILISVISPMLDTWKPDTEKSEKWLYVIFLSIGVLFLIFPLMWEIFK